MAAGYVHRILVKRGHCGVPEGALWTALATIEPLAADSLADAQLARTRHGAMTQERSAAVAEQRAAMVVDRWFSRSSDVADLALVDARLAALQWLADQDTYSCMRWLVGRDDQELSLAQLPRTLRTALRIAEADVLKDANAYPAPLVPDDGTLSATDGAVRREIAARYGPQALAHAASPEHGFDDAAVSCRVSIAYLHGLRDRPEAARLLRWAFAGA